MTKYKNNFLSIVAKQVVVTAALVLVGQYCRVHAGSAWSQLGHSICSVGDNGGFAVGLSESSNGLILAIGSPKYTETFDNQGKVQVYKFHEDSCLWSPLGNPVKGKETEDQLGTNVVLSCDGSILAVAGDTINRDDSVRTGFINVYYYNGATNEWKQMGKTLRPNEIATNFGFQLTLSCDGNTVGVGAFGYSEVLTYDSDTNDWKQKGNILRGFGHMLTALSRDGSTLVVGQRSTGSRSNSVKAHRLQNGVWTQFGNEMLLEVSDVNFPHQLAISDDGTRVVVSCPGWSNSGEKQFGAVVFNYSSGSWIVTGDTFHQGYGTNTVISGNGEYVFTSTNGYHSYHDEVASSYKLVNGRWIMTGGVYELQHSNIDDTEILATTVLGSVFAFGTTGHDDYDRDRGRKPATTDVGAVHVFFYPDAGTVNGCLPDPDVISKECDKLQEMEYNKFESDESADTIYVSLPDNFTSQFDFPELYSSSSSGGGGVIAGVVMGTVALVLAIVALALFVQKDSSSSGTGQSTQGSSKKLVSNK